MKANRQADHAVVFNDEIHLDGMTTMRLFFADTTLLGDGSFIRVSSKLDGEVQELDGATLDMWSYSTAYFNGDLLIVELVAAPGTLNQLVIDSVFVIDPLEAHAEGVPGECGICGSDDRFLTNPIDNRHFRILPAGCSGTVYNDQSCWVSAGHCIAGGDVAQFNVPLSNPNCSLNNPPVADQFPMINILLENAGVGNDWSVGQSGTNNLGQRPFDRYGIFRPLAASTPPAGTAFVQRGYGVDPDMCTKSQVQQDSPNATITFVGAEHFEDNADTRGGNSGSGVFTGNGVIGIKTHCSFGCPNFCTRIEVADFAAARQQVCQGGKGGCGDPNAGDCFIANGSPFCDDADCCNLICAQDPFCCDIEWDQICADAAIAQCGAEPTGACCLEDGSCLDGLTPGECAGQGGTYQGDNTNCGGVNCGGPGGCGDPNAGDCFIANGTPFCDDLECCLLICAQDPFCCDIEWDQICADAAIVQCGAEPTGACCLEDGNCVDGVTLLECEKGLLGIYQGNNSNCADANCPQPPVKCQGDFNGDGQVGINDLLFLLAAWGPCGSDCEPEVCGTYSFTCDPNNANCTCFKLFDGSGYCGPGAACGDDCSDGNCPPGFVCQVETCCGNPVCVADTGCVSPANNEFEFGQLTTMGIAGIDFPLDGFGDTEADDNPDCPGDFDFDGQVGITDLLKLLAVWGPCPSYCGDPNSGDCRTPNGTPYCDDAECCQAVCAIDPFCCDIQWDGICADEAIQLCQGPGDNACDTPGVCGGYTQCGVGQPFDCLCWQLNNNPSAPGICIQDFFCADVSPCGANFECPPGFVCVTNSCCGAAFCVPIIKCDAQPTCKPQVCGTYTFDCNPNNPNCVCFTLFDGSGYCGPGQACDSECGPNGECPPGFVCQVETCCGFALCAVDVGCPSPANSPSFEFGELTSLGIAGVDFEIQEAASGWTGSGLYIGD